MTCINYISLYLDLQNTSYKKSELTLSVNREVFDYLCELVTPYIKSRKAKAVSEKVAKLYFLIAFLARENFKQIKNEILYSITKDHSDLSSYKHILSELNLLETRTEKKYSKKDNLFYTEITQYHVLPILMNKFSKQRFISLCYTIPGVLNIDAGNADKGHYREFIHAKSLAINSLERINTTVDAPGGYFSLYQKLSYSGSQKITELLQSKPAKMNDDNRVYHMFHSLSKEQRKHLLLDNEAIVETFDVHNCRYTLLNVLLVRDSSIPEEEKNRYYDLTCSGRLYEDIMSYWINHYQVSNDHFTRDYIKEKANSYFCEKNKIIENSYSYSEKARRKHLMTTDMYFKLNFPHIREYIFKHKEDLHKKLNKVETKLITEEICNKELYLSRGIKALSLHDGVYVKQSDYRFLKENNISLESMFYDKLYLYWLL